MAPARQDVRGAEALEQATEQLKGDVWVLFVGGSAARGFWEGESRAAVEAVEAAAREALDDSATLIVCDVGDRGDWEAALPVHPCGPRPSSPSASCPPSSTSTTPASASSPRTATTGTASAASSPTSSPHLLPSNPNSQLSIFIYSSKQLAADKHLSFIFFTSSSNLLQGTKGQEAGKRRCSCTIIERQTKKTIET